MTPGHLVVALDNVCDHIKLVVAVLKLLVKRDLPAQVKNTELVKSLIGLIVCFSCCDCSLVLVQDCGAEDRCSSGSVCVFTLHQLVSVLQRGISTDLNLLLYSFGFRGDWCFQSSLF